MVIRPGRYSANRLNCSSLWRSDSSAARISVMSVNIRKEPRNSPSGPRSAVEDTEAQTSPPSLRLKRRSYVPGIPAARAFISACLLYTSDAADEEDSVDLG